MTLTDHLLLHKIRTARGRIFMKVMVRDKITKWKEIEYQQEREVTEVLNKICGED